MIMAGVFRALCLWADTQTNDVSNRAHHSALFLD